jgi:cysteine dioxygenase
VKSLLDDVFADFARCPDGIPADRLRRWIETCSITLQDVLGFCRFHPERYVRNLVRAEPAYHALILCWRNGHRSPIHDHTGSRCAVKVLAGEAIETRFELAPNGMVYATGSSVLRHGTTCYSEDADIHQVSNLQAGGADLVTLHVYSPPLLKMNAYSLHGHDVREFFDPVNDEFVSGAGI